MKENENFFDKTIARKLITHIILETCHMCCNGTRPFGEKFRNDENCDIAIAISSSHADPVLGFNIYPSALVGGI